MVYFNLFRLFSHHFSALCKRERMYKSLKFIVKSFGPTKQENILKKFTIEQQPAIGYSEFS